MSLSVTLTRTFNFNSDSLSQQDTVTSGALTSLSESITTGTTDGLVALVLDVSQLKAFYIQSDYDITLEFNSNAGSGGTIALKANKPVIWSENCGLTNPLGTDVTALYVTNASGSTATLNARFLLDPTV